MSTMTSKIQWTGAAFAIAVAATLSPVALADPTDPGTSDTTSASVGSSAGQAPTRSTRKDRTRTNDDAANEQSDAATGTPSGGSAGGATTGTDRASTSVTGPGADATSSAVGANPIFQNPLIWFGQPNPTPPPQTEITEFKPLASLPGFSRSMFGWFNTFEFEACVLGLSNTVIGPYDTATRAVSSEGCA